MTHSVHTPASPARFEGSIDDLDDRSRRALTERMAVTAFGRGSYEVVGESNDAYLVDLPAGRCTCPDHRFRDARCKHVRRVAIEITAGRVPGPEQAVVDCERCGETVFRERTAAEPHLCPAHELSIGDSVYDRERGQRLLVVGLSDRRADGVPLSTIRGTVADHYSNREYDADDPIVSVVYPDSFELTEHGPVPGSLTVYSFPRSRLSVTPP